MLSFLLTLLLATPPPVVDGGIVQLKGRRLLAEVARTPKERERTLAFRQMFKAERCMFVIPEQEGAHPVRTAKFLLPFDVLWADADGTVVETQERVPPCPSGQDCPEHGGLQPSRYLVLLAAGTLRRLRVKVGDRLEWDLHFSDGSELRNGSHLHASPSRSTQGRRRLPQKAHP